LRKHEAHKEDSDGKGMVSKGQTSFATNSNAEETTKHSKRLSELYLVPFSPSWTSKFLGDYPAA
jgi:hypothetical protein